MERLADLTNNVSSYADGKILNAVAAGVYDRMSTQTLQTGAIAIKGAGSGIIVNGSACMTLVAGTLVSVAASGEWTPVGTIEATKYNVFCCFVDASGAKTTLMGKQGSSLNLVKFPPIPANKAMVGFVIIQAAAGAPFVGGLALDDAATSNASSPSRTYVNTVGMFDPSALI